MNELKQFSRPGKAFYAKDTKQSDDIIYIFYKREDGDSDSVCGEFAIRWHRINNQKVARLESFSDSWAALAALPELTATLALVDRKHPTVDDVVYILLGLGFTDETAYTQQFDQNALASLQNRRNQVAADLSTVDKLIADMEALKEE